jgi:hypothetical protein
MEALAHHTPGPFSWKPQLAVSSLQTSTDIFSAVVIERQLLPSTNKFDVQSGTKPGQAWPCIARDSSYR